MDPKSPSKLKLSITGFTRHKRVLKVSIVVVLILLLFFGVDYVLKLGRAPSVVNGDYYTVVVDCGSTGTRMNVFKWKAQNLGNQDLPVLVHSYPDNPTQNPDSRSSCKYHCMQTEPGLDKFVGNATGVRVSLEPLILRAESWVPFEKHRETPVFVLATAGLRRLAIEDSGRVLDDVENVLKEHSFVHKRSWIRVLSGKEEAYYGWVALNYKMGSLRDSSRMPTLGVLDLGGSSLQVVMEVDGGAANNPHFIRSKIGLVEHQILAHSLPSFGLNEAFERTVALLSQVQLVGESTNGKLEVRHPCLGSDFSQNYTCHACQKKSNGRISESAYIYLVGDPNLDQCKGIAKAAAINSSTLDRMQLKVGTDCRARSSPYYGSNILNLSAGMHPTKRFHALSGFFAVYNMLNLAPRANLTKIEEKGEQLCSESWAASSDNSANENYIGKYCFRVPYMASLIEDALCLGDIEITFGPGDLSWTLGAALVEGEYLWLNPSETGISSLLSMKIIHSPIFVFFVLVCLLFIVYSSQIKLPMLGKKVNTIGTSLPSYINLKRRPN